MKLLSKRIQGGAAATLSVLLAASALAAMAPAQALSSAGVGARDPSRAGFPAYYTDDSNVPLQLCVDGTARCGLATLRGDGAGGPGVGVAPDGEGFYWVATSSLSTPGGLTLDIEFAAEAAWAGRRQPVTFDRLRIRGTSPTTGPITVTTPYGDFTVTAEGVGPRNVNFTEDIGCVFPCNFRDMTTVAGRHITSWITANTPPPGYLGNAVTAQPANVAGAAATFSTAAAGGDSTDRWVVMGKKAPRNRASLPNVVNFGNVKNTRTRSVAMVNLGTTTRTIRRVTLTGDRTITKLASSTCRAGKVLAATGAAARCSVVLKYRPGALRRSTARLTIVDNVGTHHVRVKGS